MRERDPHFAKAIDEIEKAIEQSFRELMDSPKVRTKKILPSLKTKD